MARRSSDVSRTSGYLHCGFEKIGEYRQYNQIIPWTDREDYLNSLGNNVAFALGAERLFGIEITPRCTVLRVIADGAVADRVAPGVAGHYLYRHWRVHAVPVDVPGTREHLPHAGELGRRPSHDVGDSGRRHGRRYPAMAGSICSRASSSEFPHTIDEVDRMLTRNGIWVGRTVGLGAISAADAENYGLSGRDAARIGRRVRCPQGLPVSGLRDVRLRRAGRHPRRCLRPVSSCVWRSCCQSTRILAQAMARLPEGPVNIDDPRVILPPKSKATSEMESMIHHFKQVMEGPRPPIGEAYVAVESPRGEKGYYMVSDGTAKPVRWRIRPPSFVNLSAIPKLVEGPSPLRRHRHQREHRHCHGRDRPVSAAAGGAADRADA